MWPRFKRDAPYLLLLAAAVLVLFWPALANPFLVLHPTFGQFSDVMVIHWPKARLLAESCHAGEGLPLWTPLILSGMPLAANQLAMLFYPPAWLFCLLPTEPLFNGLFIFHLLLGGAGVYVLLRQQLAVSPPAALLGGLTFSLNAKWLAHAAGGHVSLVGAIGWLAWTVLAAHGLLAAKSWRRRLGWALLAAATLALQITTHTLPVIYSVYLLGAMAVWQHLQAGWRNFSAHRLAESALWLAGVGVAAAMLGAAQLLPLLELAGYSNRALSPAQAAEFSVSPAQLLAGLLLPSSRGGHELIIYLGLAPLLLAPLGLSRRNRWSWFYAGVFIFAVLFALGPATPLHGLFYRFAPGFGWVRTPARIFFVAGLAVALLAGLAAERLATERWSRRSQAWLSRLAVGLGGVALLAGLGLAVSVEPVRRSALALALIVPATLAVMALASRRWLSAALTGGLLSVLIFIDLAWFDTSLLRFVPPEQALAPGRPAAEFLARRPGLFRVYSPSYSLPMQTAAAAHLQLADGVEPVHLAVVDEFMARAGGYNEPDFSVTIPNFGAGSFESALKNTPPNLKLLGLLNVRYLAAAFPMAWPGLKLHSNVDNTFVYTNTLALPRAWVAHQTEPAQADWLDQLDALDNPADVAVIDADWPQLRSTRPASPARITRFAANVIELEADIAEPGWLILSEIWYPGWQATVNDAPQPVNRVDGLLRGVFLAQPGPARIVLEYRPWTVVWGSRLSLAGAALLGLAVMYLALRMATLRPGE